MLSNSLVRMTDPVLRIASRGSPLALAQSQLVRAALAARQGWDEAALDTLCPIVPIRTTGDRIQDRPLVEAGGKGLFVKEIEEALIQGAADIAVHSMKDMPAMQPDGLIIMAVLPRENPRDIFLGRNGARFTDLAKGARLGTSSVRRQAQALKLRPDLQIVSLRGNVETRIAKLGRGEADGIILAAAGLARLKLAPAGAETLAIEDWLPALCQGAIGIEIRANDDRIRTILSGIDDEPTHLAISAERGFLAALDGSCRTPIAGLAEARDGRLTFRGEVLMPRGEKAWTAARELAVSGMTPADARAKAFALGEDAAQEIRAAAGMQLPRF
jgi:hydroxymethylbilane synthase